MPDYDMSGALFKNDKGDNPKRPDYRGDITIAGHKYTLAGWIREGKKGNFLSLKASNPTDYKPKQEPLPDLDDEIPW